MSVACLHPIKISGKLRPCGRCEVCRHKTIVDWITRVSCDIKALKMKKRQTKEVNGVNSNNFNDRKNLLTESIFFDVTYNKQFLPEDQSLSIDDYQKFLKRFRRRYEKKYAWKGIRFIAAGEYGESEDGTHRPHYHFVMWNLPNLSLEEHTKNVQEAWKSYGFVYEDDKCTIPVIDEKTGDWKRGRVSMGFSKVEIPRGQTDAAFYVAESIGYVTKNGLSKYCRHGNESLEDYYVRTGKSTFPFVRASLGLGYDYVDSHAEQMMRQGYIQDGKYQVRIPTIYQSRLKTFAKKTFFLNKLKRMADFYSDVVPFEFNDYEVDKLADFLTAKDLFFSRLRNWQRVFEPYVDDLTFAKVMSVFDYIRKKNKFGIFESHLLFCCSRLRPLIGCNDAMKRLYFYFEDFLRNFEAHDLLSRYYAYDSDLGSQQIACIDNSIQAGVNFLAKVKVQAEFRKMKADKRGFQCFDCFM